jgi:hypothetical protein
LGIQWKTKGFRSSSNVLKRVEQFAVFLFNFEFETNWLESTPSALIANFENLFKQNGIYDKSLFSNFIINAVVPFLFGLSTAEFKKINYQDLAISLLNILPPESNVFVKKWKNINVNSKSAFDSQAALEIYQQFCTRKQCLNCTVGIKILNP